MKTDIEKKQRKMGKKLKIIKNTRTEFGGEPT
jgi:hypothetical protein